MSGNLFFPGPVPLIQECKKPRIAGSESLSLIKQIPGIRKILRGQVPLSPCQYLTRQILCPRVPHTDTTEQQHQYSYKHLLSKNYTTGELVMEYIPPTTILHPARLQFLTTGEFPDVRAKSEPANNR